MSESPVDRRLRELTRLTDGIRASAGFGARVLSAVRNDAEAAFGLELFRAARLFLPVALVLTVVSLGLALQSTPASAAELAVAEPPLELAW